MSYEIPKKVEVFGKDIVREQLQYHQKTVRVSKEFTFDSAHHLHCYEGKCQSLHGHTYKLQVIMSGKPDYRGIVIDFSDIKKLVKQFVLDRLDHHYLNDVLPPMNTTAENMVVWIFEEISRGLAENKSYNNVSLDEVVLWETPTSFASVTKEMMKGID